MSIDSEGGVVHDTSFPLRFPPMKIGRLVLATILTIAAMTPLATLAENRDPDPSKTSIRSGLPIEGTMPPLEGATSWVNSTALTPPGLRGKVVLVDFWTYTCINWLRTLPYIRGWAAKYKAQGLVVVGVHTPEFGFEQSVENVSRAVKAMNIEYPVALDSNYRIWRAFNNAYWPALYLIDAQGRIRYHHFGEGEYEQSERLIQQLLAEAGNSDVSRTLISVDPQGVEAPADWSALKSPENYLGTERTDGFASSGGASPGRSRLFTAPARLQRNHWALAGNWTTEKSFVALKQAGGRIAYQFHARDLHMVMGPAVQGTPVRFRVLIDGEPPGSGHGADVDEGGFGIVDEQRLYQLVRQRESINDRRFEIEFFEPGVQAFAVTFG